MLYATPALDPADERVLGEIDQMRSELQLFLREPKRWDRQLRRNLTARAIRGSTTIEGYPASVDDVEDIMVGEEPLQASETTAVEVEGYQRAMSYVQRLADADADFAYEKGLLNGLHFMMQGHHTRQRPGWWRDGPVWVTSPEDPRVPAYTAPDADQVPDLMSELVEWLNHGDLDAPDTIRAAMAHLNLVKIHPWRDGNGRMSRALQTLVLARGGEVAPEFSSIEEWLGRSLNTMRYYDVLERVGGAVWTPANDTHDWIRFCLRAHHQQAKTVAVEVETSSTVWIQLEKAIAGTDYPERTLYALFPAAMGHRVRRAAYQADAGIGEQAAQRDIRQLIRDGWLVSHGAARSRHYLAGPSVPEEITSAALEPYQLIDPYA